MLSIRKSHDPVRAFLLVTAIALAGLNSRAAAAEEPGHLTIVPDSGTILLDYDTLSVEGASTFDIAPGEHIISFFPAQAEIRWAHLYVDYRFSLGAAGFKTIDLARRDIFSLRSEPQSAEIQYRGRVVGRTPGDYMFLLGLGDSVTIGLPGYRGKSIDLDRSTAAGNVIFASLEQLSPEEYAGELEPSEYGSPLRPLLEPQVLTTLGAGAALLAVGVQLNKKANDNYDRYLHLAGSQAIEKAYRDAIHDDRLSKTAFIAGDISIGIAGYFLIRKLIVRHPSGAEKHRPLSLRVSRNGAALAYRF